MNLENLHYKILKNEYKRHGSHILYRIEATVDTQHAKKGDIGGYIEKYENLQGNAWVADEALVYGNAHINNNALIKDKAKVFGDATVYGDAEISDFATIYGYSMVSDNARVRGSSTVNGRAIVHQYAVIQGNTGVSDKSTVKGCANIKGHSYVGGNCTIQGNAIIDDFSHISGNAVIYDNAKIRGKSQVKGNSRIRGSHEYTNCYFGGDAAISNESHYLNIKGIGSASRITTFHRTQKGNYYDVGVVCGCFNGTLDEFYDRIYLAYGDSNKSDRDYHRKWLNEYILAIRLAEVHFGTKVKRPFIKRLLNKY